MAENLNNKVVKATKWSAMTEVAAKLVQPITSMILARLLTPEAFGVVTTLTMIISFADLITDAGFQKYLVQHDFKDETDLTQSTNVAFWTNLLLSLFIWGTLAAFAEPLATMVGNSGLGFVLIIACSTIPISALSSIQTALYKRNLDFKTLFRVRIISISIPLFITVPLAFWLRSYWALVIGGIVQSVVSAVFLTLYSCWKPQLYYSFHRLKEMFSFSIWSLAESISIWLTCYVDVFIVSTMLNQHYLGLYKTSTTLVSQIMGLITATSTPILFSALSRLQNDEIEFQRLFFKFQKIVGMLVIPIGAGIFCFSDLITEIMLGDQWTETINFIGLWGLMSSITIVLSHYSSEVYRAKGLPKLSVLAQWLHIVVLWPVVLIAAKHGFHTLYVARSFVRLELIIVNLIIIDLCIHISPWQMIRNILPSLIASIPIYIIAHGIRQIDDGIGFEIIAILLSSLAYLSTIGLFPAERRILIVHKFNPLVLNRFKHRSNT